MDQSFAKTPLLNIILIALLFLSGCGGSGKKDENGNKDQKGTEEKKSQKELSKEKKDKKDRSKGHVLPSTLQVASSFKKAGLPFKKGLILPHDKVDQLVKSDRKKLAFGAYSADLAYLVINEKEDKALKVMSALLKLADQLNISSVFNTEGIAERFRSNLENRDSLVKLIVEVQKRFDTYVAKNRDRQLRTIAYAGGWSEAMYLAANSDINEKKKLHLEVEEQMAVLGKLLKALDRDIKKAEGPLADLIQELKKMKQLYKKQAPKPGEKLPSSLMNELKKRANKARAIISNNSRSSP